LAFRHPKGWREDQKPSEKDIVCVADDRFSIEVKTSSNPARIFGNRSYAREGKASKKGKSGYCLAVNFGKFRQGDAMPRVLLIRFGWLDSTDWIGQEAATGQQSRLPKEVEASKFAELYKPT
jgi:hypothetical protein